MKFVLAHDPEHVWLSPESDGADAYQPLALLGSNRTSWVTGDHLGTPVLLTNVSGAVVNAYDTTPFGQRWFTRSASPTTAQAFPGQLIDIADRYYNMHRDYDPTLGRYLQADPIGLAGGDNVYGYVEGNPVGRINPSGRIPLLIIPGICAAGGCEAIGLGIAAAASVAISNPIERKPDKNRYTPIPKRNYSKTLTSNFYCPEPDDEDCQAEIKQARNFCDTIAAQKGFGSGRSVGGANYQQCLRGQVSECCGGNKYDRTGGNGKLSARRK